GNMKHESAAVSRRWSDGDPFHLNRGKIRQHGVIAAIEATTEFMALDIDYKSWRESASAGLSGGRSTNEFIGNISASPRRTFPSESVSYFVIERGRKSWISFMLLKLQGLRNAQKFRRDFLSFLTQFRINIV